jgi:cobalt-zinc-cadmium efflux system protein
MTHDHTHSRGSVNQRRLVLVFWLTASYLLVELAGAWLTHSLALFAEAGHMLTDVVGLGLALFAIRFAARPATPERTYGYYRVEILATVSNCVLLIGLSIYVLVEAYHRLKSPPEVHGRTMLLVALFGLCVNFVGFFALKEASTGSLNVKAAYYEVVSDMLTAVGVIVAGAIIWLTRWYYVDPLISAGIGLFILPRTWLLLRESVGILLEGTPSDVNLTAIRQALVGMPGVLDVHDLHVWTLTSGMNAMSVHVVHIDTGNVHDAVLSAVRRTAKNDFHIAHVTVQIESQECADAEEHL